MKKMITLLLTVVILTLPFGVGQAEATMNPLSSETFRIAKATFFASGSVIFTATTRHRATVKVNSCILQKKEGNNWVFDQSLSCPPSVSNVTRYSKNMDYSAKLTIGTTYRVVAVFDAEGETRTATSDGITY